MHRRTDRTLDRPLTKRSTSRCLRQRRNEPATSDTRRTLHSSGAQGTEGREEEFARDKRLEHVQNTPHRFQKKCVSSSSLCVCVCVCVCVRESCMRVCVCISQIAHNRASGPVILLIVIICHNTRIGPPKGSMMCVCVCVCVCVWSSRSAQVGPPTVEGCHFCVWSAAQENYYMVQYKCYCEGTKRGVKNAR